jgi:hypothetical protein
MADHFGHTPDIGHLSTVYNNYGLTYSSYFQHCLVYVLIVLGSSLYASLNLHQFRGSLPFVFPAPNASAISGHACYNQFELNRVAPHFQPLPLISARIRV